jgi:hypothetical protein
MNANHAPPGEVKFPLFRLWGRLSGRSSKKERSVTLRLFL